MQQGWIHGYPSRVRLGRGSDKEGHLWKCPWGKFCLSPLLGITMVPDQIHSCASVHLKELEKKKKSITRGMHHLAVLGKLAHILVMDA